MLFFFLVVLIYAGVGIQFMQDELIPYDRVPLKDYTSFGGLVVNMYIMITFDNWPSFARPLICSPRANFSANPVDVSVLPALRDREPDVLHADPDRSSFRLVPRKLGLNHSDNEERSSSRTSDLRKSPYECASAASRAPNRTRSTLASSSG